jgi:RelA/SpoT family (p)ppGpp synthetase
MMQSEALVPTEKFIEYIEGRFPKNDVELVTRVCTFTGEHYHNLKHPIGKSYIQYVIEVARLLADLYADPIIIAAALIYPPHANFDALEEIRKEFKNECGLIELVEEVYHLNQYDWNIWPALVENDTFRERQEILRRMFLLAIEDTHNEDEEQNFLTANHFQKREKQAENLIKMLFAATTDIRALLIKLADRLLFMRLLKDLPPLKQDEVQYKILAKLSITIYASIADRLGMWQLKSDLEDMSFRLLDMQKYKEIAGKIAAKKQEREEYLTSVVIPTLKKSLKEYGIEAQIHGRAKHIYSIYKKMETRQLSFDEINDLLGVRIIVDIDDNCYYVQSILHEYWSPLTEVYEGKAGRDWIANPKDNLYQSLHTTILIEDKAVEVQIRTRKMHEIAENGVIALKDAVHWRYKASKTYGKAKTPMKASEKHRSKQLANLRKILYYDQTVVGSEMKKEQEAAISMLKDLLKDRIFVITPQGHVINLPVGATPLDFAYRIHTDLGHRYAGAKVDNHLVQLNYKLKNGDIVDLITSRARKGPSPEWLTKCKDEEGHSTYMYVITRLAREKIHRELNKQKPKAQK